MGGVGAFILGPTLCTNIIIVFVSSGHINMVTVIRMLSSLFFSSAHIDMVAVLLFGNHSYDSKLQNFRILFY